jgi:hypothetical protein
MTLAIAQIPMTREHYATGRTMPIRALVMHATAGVYPGDLEWLKKGGSTAYPVSTHYLVNKAGEIFQFVREEDTAWHAGTSSWVIDGKRISGLNKCSVGIELSNANNGRDPYPREQIESAVALARDIVTRRDIPRAQLVRHLDISPGRKTDPAGFPWLYFTDAVYRDTAMTRVIGVRPSIGLDRFLDILTRRQAPFGEHLQTIGTRIYTLCDWLDIDPAFWLAVWTHEQGVPLGQSAIGQQTRNPFNIKAYGRWPAVEMRGVRWNYYSDWQQGAMHAVIHLKEMYGARGLLDVETIIPVFAPSGDGNAPQSYINAVLRDMAAMREP